MKAVILAGGYGTRLKEIAKDRPKCLLPVKNKPIADYVVEKLEKLNLEKIYLSTNIKFSDHFENWMKTNGYKNIELVLEPSREDSGKIGSVGGLDFLIKVKNIKDDLLVVAGDNLFDFNLNKLLDFFNQKKSIVFGLYKLNLEEAHKFGVGKLDSTNKLIDFEEKPENPKSNLISTAIYLIPKDKLNLVEEYLKDSNNTDKFGDFIKWLYKKVPVYGFVFEGKWFDIGSPETYKKAKEEFVL